MNEGTLMPNVSVKKRHGNTEPLILDKINKSAERACEGLENVSASEIVLDASFQLYDGVPTIEIDKSLILSARAKIEKEPNYSYVAARLLLNNLYKEVFNTGVEHDLFEDQYKQAFIDNLYEMVDAERINPELLNFDLEMLSEALVIERDLKFKYLGIQTIYDRYLIHIEGRKMETPQAFFMRVAMGLAYDDENKEQKALEYYHSMSQFLYMPSTPTLFNSGTNFPQLSSCYLSTMDDSEDGIMGTIHDQARLSKFAGGVAIDWGYVRGEGARIKKTNGKSSGPIPFMKILNDTLVAFDQGGKRKGAGVSYLPDWHLQVEDFCDLKKNTGDERRRCHDMNTALWCSDLFFKKVFYEKDSYWYLFSPDEVSDLHDSYGKDFEKKYNKYVSLAEAGKIKTFKKVEAKSLFKKILISALSTGHPWICFKDISNILYTNKNEGIVHSSNLCTEILRHTKKTLYEMGQKKVLGETAVCLAEGSLVLTDNGYLPIEECNDKYVYTQYTSDSDFIQNKSFEKAKLIYNGEKYVYKITLNNGYELEATDNHPILTKYKDNSKLRYKKNDYSIPDGYQWKQLKNIKIGDFIAISCNDSLSKEKIVQDDDYLTAGWILGDGWQAYSNYGVCFGPTEFKAKDFVMNKIKEWFIANISDSGNGRFPQFEAKPDKNGVFCWASGNQLWKDFLEKKFGFKQALAKNKDIYECIRNKDLNKKASFLSGLFSADGCALIDTKGRISVCLTSASKQLLLSTQKILNEFGIRSIIVDSYPRKRYQGSLRIHGYKECKSFYDNINFLLCENKSNKLRDFLNKNIESNIGARNCSKVQSIELVGVKKVYDLCLEKKHHFVANGIVVHNCNLASINLVEHVYFNEDKKVWLIDYTKLAKTVETAINSLDDVIDKNHYPIKEAQKSNLRHRPIGLGIMGFSDLLHILEIPYESQSAVDIAGGVQEFIYYHAIKTSIKLAKEKGKFKSYKNSEWDSNGLPHQLYKDLEKFRGKKIRVPSYNELDWEPLCQDLGRYGIRNSSLLAIAPTATISSIVGCSQSIEPDYGIIYVYSTLSGEFTIINEHFVKRMKSLGLWCNELVDAIKKADGDVLQLNIPDEIKEEYKGAFDIDYRYLVDAASARQKYIDMGQSFNIYCGKPSMKYLADIYQYCWEKDLKTTYYVRAKAASKVEKSSCSIEAMKRGEICESCT